MIPSRKRPATGCGNIDSNIKNKYPKQTTETMNMDLPETNRDTETACSPTDSPAEHLAAEKKLSEFLVDSFAKLNYSGSRSAFSIFTKKSHKTSPIGVPNDSSDHSKLNEHTSWV